MRLDYSKIDTDWKFSLFIVGIYSTKALGYCWVASVGDSGAFQVISKIIQVCLIFFVVKDFIRKPSKLIACEVFFSIAFLFSYIMGYADNSLLSRDWIMGSVLFIPMGIAAYMILNKRILLDMFFKASCLCFPFLLISVIILFNKGETVYDMTFGYLMIVPTVFFLNKFKETKIIFYLILVGMGLVAILLYGSRGPILCVTGYFILVMFISTEIKLFVRIALLLSIGTIGTIVYYNFYKILKLLMELATRLNVNSRSLYLINAELTFSASGREEIWESCLELLNRHPLMGLGITGLEGVINNYAHNLFLDMLISFGYFGGSVVITLCLCLIVRGIFCPNPEIKESCIVFVSLCMGLLVSSAFYLSWEFYVCMGLCFSAKYKTHIHIRKSG